MLEVWRARWYTSPYLVVLSKNQTLSAIFQLSCLITSRTWPEMPEVAILSMMPGFIKNIKKGPNS